MAKGSKPKFSPTQVESNTDRIKATQINENKNVSFNFRYLVNSDKFNFEEKDKQYFLKLLERISSVCMMTRRELAVSRSSAWRCHQITWSDTTEESFGMSNEDICDEAWQFEISKSEHGRVHGFFIEDVFYVRWLDPNHKLYS